MDIQLTKIRQLNILIFSNRKSNKINDNNILIPFFKAISNIYDLIFII
jgi:hypothetical protein